MESSGLAEASPAQSAPARPLHAFAAFGIEIEYMIVDRASLDVRPLADRVLRALDRGTGPMACDVARGALGWSNELVLHLLELKNERPWPDLARLAASFQGEVEAVRPVLEQLGARLMPGGMHPWMDPCRETALWPHDGRAVYEAYDRIFDCRRHGWANLQAMHLNLPFAGDREFERLHAAVRAVLPLVPALAASSPFVEGQATGALDYRLEVYRTNADRVPALAGEVVPENYASRAQYASSLLAPLYQAIAEFDPDGRLQHEWLNARGAIARFDRSAIEIRVADVQEHPGADVAIAALLADAVWWLYQSGEVSVEPQQALATRRLADVLVSCGREAEQATIDYAPLLALFGMQRNACDAARLWEHIGETLERARAPHAEVWRGQLQRILVHGPLARRLLAAAGPAPNRAALGEVYRALCDCLAAGRDFLP